MLGGLILKLKVLPPTIRKNNHYLVIDVIFDGVLDKDQLVNIVWDGCVRFWGEMETSNFNLWVMRFAQVGDCSQYNQYRAVVRCQRGFEEELRAALTCINNYKHKRISIATIGLSGTVKACMDRYFD